MNRKLVQRKDYEAQAPAEVSKLTDVLVLLCTHSLVSKMDSVVGVLVEVVKTASVAMCRYVLHMKTVPLGEMYGVEVLAVVRVAVDVLRMVTTQILAKRMGSTLVFLLELHVSRAVIVGVIVMYGWAGVSISRYRTSFATLEEI